MPNRVSRASFATSKSHDVALSKAADLTTDHTEVGVATRTAPFIISTEAVDRDGDTLALDGWDLTDYKKNPIVLFDHDPKSPIGKSLSTFTGDGALRAVAWFAEKDTCALADTVFKLIQADVLRTASVTFLPLEFTQALDRAANSPWGAPPMNFKRQKLLEWSVVSVPSNQEALRQAKSLKVDWKGYNDWIERSLDEATAPLPAPRVEYEKTHAVVKSFLSTAKAKPPTTTPSTEDTPMKTSKGGKVLNKDNLARMKAAMKHADTAADCHDKAFALQDKASKHMEKCAEHMKAIMESHDSGASEDDETEDGDAGDSDNTGSKDASDAGVAQEVADEGSGAGDGSPVGEVSPGGLPDAEDYYQEFGKPGKKEAALLARAKAAIKAAIKGAAVPTKEEPDSSDDEPYSEEEMQAAINIALERQHQKHLRTLRGQE